jgi:hypothetical protein
VQDPFKTIGDVIATIIQGLKMKCIYNHASPWIQFISIQLSKNEFVRVNIDMYL